MLRLKMTKIKLFKGILVQKVPLLVIAITLTMGLLSLQQQIGLNRTIIGLKVQRKNVKRSGLQV
jgi:hypothetical protein